MNIAYNMDYLPAMRETQDNFYDLAVCDPPYGSIGTNKVSRTGGTWAAKFGKKS